MDDLKFLQQSLAEALTERERLNRMYADALAVWEAEMGALLQARAQAIQAAKEIESEVRERIRQTVEQEGALPPLTGLSSQVRSDIVYDDDSLLRWAMIHAPELVETSLKTKTYIMGWLEANARQAVDAETGERVFEVDFVHNGFDPDTTRVLTQRVPVQLLRVVTPVVSAKGLMTWLDEQRWQEANGA